MSDGEKNFLSEFELNKLLAAAGKPEPLRGFEQRMAQRIAAAASGSTAVGGNNVIAFRPRVSTPVAPSRRLRLPFAAAMAASLVIGLWLGGSGQVSNILDQASETAMLITNPDSAGDSNIGFAPAGLEELGNADMDSLS